ncbi:hypothetical protein CRUP_033154 [Coryphaenoides rupestris]|nr:hypothetical protein CRUP_033154 [Coryphaenoides rupestris]
MGSRESRPRWSQVAPVHNQDHQESGDRKPGESTPQWRLPALAVQAEQRTVGQRTESLLLPPLKQPKAAQSTLSGHLPFVQSDNPSIILSYPPKRPQAGGRRGGATQQYSAPREQEGHDTNRQTQEGFLGAQGALQQQAYQRRRARHRQAREHRRTQRTVCTSNGHRSKEGGPLVRRPTERDVFWGEYDGGGGERLWMSCYSQAPPNPLPAPGPSSPLLKRQSYRDTEEDMN